MPKKIVFVNPENNFIYSPFRVLKNIDCRYKTVSKTASQRFEIYNGYYKLIKTRIWYS